MNLPGTLRLGGRMPLGDAQEGRVHAMRPHLAGWEA